jgi:hypothetical protein
MKIVGCDFHPRWQQANIQPPAPRPILEPSRSGFACAPAYGSEVAAFGDDFVPGTKVPGFYLEARCASGVLNFVKGAESPVVGQFDLGVKVTDNATSKAFQGYVRVGDNRPRTRLYRAQIVNVMVGSDLRVPQP